jgi:hypothetical protein
VAPVVVVQVGVGGEDGAVLQEQVHHILYLAVVHLPAHNKGVLLLEGAARWLPAVQGVPANIATSNLREKIIVFLHNRTYHIFYIILRCKIITPESLTNTCTFAIVPNGVAKLYLKWKIQIFSSIIIMSSPMFQIQTKPSVSKPSRQVLLCRFKNGGGVR